jgi:hypothetical protein
MGSRTKLSLATSGMVRTAYLGIKKIPIVLKISSAHFNFNKLQKTMLFNNINKNFLKYMDAGPNRSPVGWQLFVIYIYILFIWRQGGNEPSGFPLYSGIFPKCVYCQLNIAENFVKRCRYPFCTPQLFVFIYFENRRWNRKIKNCQRSFS